MREVLRLLNCYYEDMRYHAKITDVSGINAVTNGTPSFTSDEELEAYLERVAGTIGEFTEELDDE
jgi:phytoene/squalene synthetase